MPTYVIGDVQGCYRELMGLLEKINFGPQDILWFCGDLINRGPDSLDTLKFIRNLWDKNQALVVLGNHDLHLLARAYTDCGPDKTDTIDAILSYKNKDNLLTWLRHQPLLHYAEKHNAVLSHAGIYPLWDLKKARGLSKEVEQVLQSNNFINLLNNMYGNNPSKWDDELEDTDRLRFIINSFTRMRFLDKNYNLDLETKSGIDNQPINLFPWFEKINPDLKNKIVLFGHWAALNGKVDCGENIFALDTGCVYGNCLTALRLEDKKLFQYPSLKH